MAEWVLIFWLLEPSGYKCSGLFAGQLERGIRRFMGFYTHPPIIIQTSYTTQKMRMQLLLVNGAATTLQPCFRWWWKMQSQQWRTPISGIAFYRRFFFFLCMRGRWARTERVSFQPTVSWKHESDDERANTRCSMPGSAPREPSNHDGEISVSKAQLLRLQWEWTYSLSQWSSVQIHFLYICKEDGSLTSWIKKIYIKKNYNQIILRPFFNILHQHVAGI